MTLLGCCGVGLLGGTTADMESARTGSTVPSQTPPALAPPAPSPLCSCRWRCSWRGAHAEGATEQTSPGNSPQAPGAPRQGGREGPGPCPTAHTRPGAIPWAAFPPCPAPALPKLPSCCRVPHHLLPLICALLWPRVAAQLPLPLWKDATAALSVPSTRSDSGAWHPPQAVGSYSCRRIPHALGTLH